ncbi:hypothetical protein B0H10DRAFT_1994506 [Mycena sp. CBHHK59/15]|nr:hypothetical protein B0H10DRAFT_1994506 [Mycena sp. CBHHK59/15]
MFSGTFILVLCMATKVDLLMCSRLWGSQLSLSFLCCVSDQYFTHGVFGHSTPFCMEHRPVLKQPGKPLSQTVV